MNTESKDKPCFKCGGTGKMKHPYGPGGKEVPGMGCRYCGGSGKATYTPVKKEGYGALDMSKDKKQAFKGAHWTVKFNEASEKIGAGQTPPNEKSIKSIISKLKPNTAVSFYSLTKPGLHVSIRRTSDKNFDVVDSGGAEYRLAMPNDDVKVDLIVKQLAVNSRRYNQYQIFQTIASRPLMSPPKGIKQEELKEVIRELVTEMWVDTGPATGPADDMGGEGGEEGDGLKTTGRIVEPGADAALVDLYKDGGGSAGTLPSVGGAMSENQEYQDWIKNYLGEKCPKCGNFHHAGERGPGELKVLNPNNPTVYQCAKCSHKWNPDNEKSTITKVGDRSVLAKEEYPGDKWNPKPFTKTPEEVSTLIFGLKEGEGITFMSEKQGRSTDWVAVEKTVEGDEYVYKQFQYNDQGAKHYLETDEDVLDFATEIAKNPKLTLYEFHEVTTSTGQAYRKSSYYEGKTMKREEIKELIRETVSEMEHGDYDENKEVEMIKNIALVARDANRRISGLQPEEIQRAFRVIERLANELVKMHGPDTKQVD